MTDFCISKVLNVANLVSIRARPRLVSSMFPLILVCSSVLCCRLILNLREVARGDREGDEWYSLVSPFKASEIEEQSGTSVWSSPVLSSLFIWLELWTSLSLLYLQASISLDPEGSPYDACGNHSFVIMHIQVVTEDHPVFSQLDSIN